MQLVFLTKSVVLGFLAALGFIVLGGLLNGGINTRYLLSSRERGGKIEFSTARLQLLIFTLGVALKYTLDAANASGSGALPDISSETIALLGGSHAVFLSGKAFSTLSGPDPKQEKHK